MKESTIHEQTVDTVMLFAAGLGNRMRHLTENNPKSLIPVLGKPILHYVLELCSSYPFKRVIINTHYLHEQIEDSIAEFKKLNPNFPEIITIYEKELLETGGAIKNAIELLGNKPIFTMNTDSITVSDHNVFNALLDKWDPKKMEFLLLLQPYAKSVGYRGHGDFELELDGRISRPDIDADYSYLYAGIQLLNPLRVAKNPLKIFSLREYYLNNNHVYGTTVDGTKWYHATTPEDLIDIEMDLL